MNISSNKITTDFSVQTKKLKREKTFSGMDTNLFVVHNRFYSNNSINTTMEKILCGDKSMEMKNNNKIHKEINIEDFLLIEKKFI